jgi:TRAP-type mannitol/chloroaromatic compound transport system permease small subunit
MDNVFVWFFSQIAYGFYNFGYAITHPASFLNWSDPKAMMKFIYYGGSVEFFFVIFDILLILTIIGFMRPAFMWAIVRIIEKFNNTTGRIFAWAGLAMVLQQIVIVFQQRIFRVSELSFGFGSAFTKDLSWYAEELKLYNALVVALCCAYTFTQGGHVRVDLFYSGMKYRTKKFVDMMGSLFFILPVMVLTWMYGWFFLWRHLITPKVSATDKLSLLERKAQLLKWNVETIGFSPNGFNGYFLFKFLLVGFAFMMMLAAVAFFYRSLLEFREGPESEGKYHDKDKMGDEEAELVAEIH